MKELDLRKALAAVLVLMLAASMLAGCGGQSSSSSDESKSGAAEELSTDNVKTIGDILALETEEMQNAVYDGKAVYAFKYDGTYYRIVSSISEEDQQKYFDIDFSDEDYEQQQIDIVKDLPVETVENLDSQLLSQDELDALAGKTGAELVKDGWTYQGSYYLDEMEFILDNGPFAYTVTFDGDAKGKNTDDYDPEKETKKMKVKAVRFESLGDATNVD